MGGYIILFTLLLILTLYIADKTIFKNIKNSFNTPEKLYNSKELSDPEKAFEESLNEIPVGCSMLFLILFMIIIPLLIMVATN